MDRFAGPWCSSTAARARTVDDLARLAERLALCSQGLHAADVPAALRPAARSTWVVRWSSLLVVAAQRAFAASLLELPLAGECNVAGAEPELHEVLTDVRSLPVPSSRQGPR